MILQEFLNTIKSNYRIVGQIEGKKFDNFHPIDEANELSLVWVSPLLKNKQMIVERTLSQIIVCNESIYISKDLLRTKCFIITSNPRELFTLIVKTLNPKIITYSRHPTSVIHPEANISEHVYIGPNSSIGRCTIGKGTIIDGNCFLYDGVNIGRNVRIHAGTIIGSDGFGFFKDDSGTYENFPHIGGVTIEDNVEIGSNTCIDRGALANTVIKKGVKIDNLVHIAHNSYIGENTLVIAHAMVGGSARIGKDVWIAPCTCIRDGVTLGDKVIVGMGSVVTKDINDENTVIGSPARNIIDFKKFQKIVNNLLVENNESD